MKNVREAMVAVGLLVVLTANGCSSGEAATMTAEQEAAARHPTIDPNYKGPSKEGLDKMQQSIAEYQRKHANDKIGFTK